MTKKSYILLAAPFVVALLIMVVVLGGAFVKNRRVESAAAGVIDAEAQGLVARDYNQIMAVYDDSATIVETSGLGSDRFWSGKPQIIQKYRATLKFQKFKGLSHTEKEISISGDTAVVISGTKGEYQQWQGSMVKINTTRSEKWTLKQVKGEWKVVRYIYGDEALRR